MVQKKSEEVFEEKKTDYKVMNKRKSEEVRDWWKPKYICLICNIHGSDPLR